MTTDPAARLSVTWFEDAQTIADALGLAVRLPDVGSKDPDYWSAFWADVASWRDSLKGRVAMTDAELDGGDERRVRLIVRGDIAIDFDVRNGISWKCTTALVDQVVAKIRWLASEHPGLRLATSWPGCVVACQIDDVDDATLDARMLAAGFAEDGARWRLVVGERTAVVRGHGDIGGYDTSDLRACVRQMGEDMRAGRLDAVIDRELAGVRRLFGGLQKGVVADEQEKMETLNRAVNLGIDDVRQGRFASRTVDEISADIDREDER